jgi:ATP-binding cassette, subfamily B, bacterial
MKSLLYERKSKFILYIIACLLPIIPQLMQIGVLALIFETVEKQSMEFFRMAIFISAGFIIYNAASFIVSRMMRISYMRDVLLSLRIHAFDKIIEMEYKQFNQQSRDVYLSHLINDINTFENSFFTSLINFIFRCGLYVSVLGILAFFNWMIAIIVFVASILVLLISRLYEKKTVQLQKEVSTQNETFTVDVANTFNGLEILKLNNIESTFLKKNEKQILRLEDKKKKFNVFTSFQIYTNVTIGYLLFMGLLIYLMYQTREGLGYGELVLTIQLSSNAIFPLVNMMPLLNVLKSSKAIYEKITIPVESKTTNHKPNEFKFENEIVLDNVAFAYDERQILKPTKLTLKKGQKYLMRGPSGSGKSTFVKLISQIIDDYEGQITFDGVDLKTISTQSFSKRVSYIYQDVFLFEATLKENITLFKTVDDKKVIEACHKAGLKEFLDELPLGIHTPISENGKNLSGGERQRISIARALLKDADILFVDEATSALNDELGRTIEETLLSLDVTLIAISHKTFEGISSKYDWVLEIKDGFIMPYKASEYFNEVTS